MQQCEGETRVNLKDFNPELVRQGPGVMKWDYHYLAGGFKYFLFSSLPGEGFHFDSYFSKGLKPPTSYCGDPS